MTKDLYISVDVETAGPFPAHYALLSIGACLVSDPDIHFYVELKPDRCDSLPEALEVSGLSLELLNKTGHAPADAMREFANWIQELTQGQMRPVFVALNAPFDWMFVCDYFYRYLGFNPFGHSALDIKAFYMGSTGVDWSQTSFEQLARFLDQKTELVHNALQDAQDQAQLFATLRAKMLPR